MLCTTEITAELTLTPGTKAAHQLHWRPTLEFALDCFICERTGRTTLFELGTEKASCSGTRSGLGRHHTPARIAAFDITGGDDRLAIRVLIDFWWAGFEDGRSGRRSESPTGHSWVRLHLGHSCRETGKFGEHSIQTNESRPHDLRCPHCDRVLATDTGTPGVRLLG